MKTYCLLIKRIVKVLLIFSIPVCHSTLITAQTGEEVHGEWLLPHEKDNNISVTYIEMIHFLERLAGTYDTFYIDTFGRTDAGLPLHLCMLSDKPYQNGAEARAAGKIILWINNGIHPGEPEGMDATLSLLRDLIQSGRAEDIVKDMVILVLPVYNVGGMLQRNSLVRVNQNGPEAYGFRGNARYLDLNRDFIKSKSANAQSFNRKYTEWLPDVFLDNHTSNGADYQHVMTLITTQHQKLGGPAGAFLHETFEPDLYRGMETKGYPMCPYVSTRTGLPEDGIYAFNDTPRYSSGYAALFGAMSFMAETHMFKPFVDRVNSNYALMEVMIETMIRYKEPIRTLQNKQTGYYTTQASYPIQWKQDLSRHDSIEFMGYKAGMRTSAVMGNEVRSFDRTRPWTAKVAFFNYFKEEKQVSVPVGYLIPQSYPDIIERLARNGVSMVVLSKDTLLDVEQYYLDKYTHAPNLFEGQHINFDVQVRPEKKRRTFSKGDIFVPSEQPAIRYILEVLEPEGADSFFAWNFFDAVLSRKEYFSPYIFDRIAEEILDSDPELRTKFLEKKATDERFEKNAGDQLRYIYENSMYAEPDYRVYPVFRYFGEELK